MKHTTQIDKQKGTIYRHQKLNMLIHTSQVSCQGSVVCKECMLTKQKIVQLELANELATLFGSFQHFTREIK